MEMHMERRTFLNGLAGMGTVFMTGAPDPLQYIPRESPSKEKWAVLFGTWCGSTRDASIWISEGMGGIASVFDVRQKPDLKAYDYLIVGTGIHGGKGPELLESYIKDSIADFKSKIKALFVVCGSGGDRPSQKTEVAYIDNYLAKLCQTSSTMNRIFPGRITKALLPEEDVKRLGAIFIKQRGSFDDYDHLDRWECMEFGRKILLANQPAGAASKKG
jgi:menaquinone-dependent protoporphyrinogen IX oxidase